MSSESKTLDESPNPLDLAKSSTYEDQNPSDDSNPPEDHAGEEEEEEEEEGECGFCLFMKGGGCRETFIAWENCIEESEKSGDDIVEKCFEATSALKKCMEAHSDYYEPVLRAEKVAEAEAIRELEKEKDEKEALNSGDKEEKAAVNSESKEESNSGDKELVS